jgi:hypothetical protein
MLIGITLHPAPVFFLSITLIQGVSLVALEAYVSKARVAYIRADTVYRVVLVRWIL